jgi:ubiquinone/menaquinone biosynthesis C-methylase UbiE
MVTRKPNKELAFLHDLFVATDWGERFAELIDEHIVLPEKGQALYLASGTGGHAIALQERADKGLKFVGIDENEAYLELARNKAIAMKNQAEFRFGIIDSLDLEDNQFELAIGDASLLDPARVPGMLEEMVRVVKPGGTVALNLATASSFAEFFSIYWEALHNCQVADHESDVEKLIVERPTVSEIETLAENEGLQEVLSWTRVEEFDFETGEDFFNSPLISEFLLVSWLNSIPEDLRTRVTQEITRIINEERHDSDFALSVKATLMVGRKCRSN